MFTKPLEYTQILRIDAAALPPFTHVPSSACDSNMTFKALWTSLRLVDDTTPLANEESHID